MLAPIFNRIPRKYKNRYFIFGVLTFLFILWMLFFDRNDWLTLIKTNNSYDKLLEEKNFYEDNIKVVEEDIARLRTDERELEKFAREKYKMKAKDEDVFIVVREER